MLLFTVLLYVAVTLFLTLTGLERQNQGMRIFFISLLLTPLVGLIYLFHERRKVTRIHYYHCPECDYIFPEKLRNCPICEEQHKRIRLTKYVSPFDVSDKIKPLELAS